MSLYKQGTNYPFSIHKTSVMKMGNGNVVLVLLFLSIAVPISMATVHTVGDEAGWALGVDYTTWSASKTFALGDSLVFNYGSGHTVDEVTSADYTSCTVSNSITSDSSGTTTITLKTAGVHHFICGVMGHCGGGMKLSLNVGSTLSTGTPPSTTTPFTGTPPSTDDSSTGISTSVVSVFVSSLVTLVVCLLVHLY